MKILFVTRGFPTRKNPLDGHYEAVQAKELATKGHEVTVLAVKYRNFFTHAFSWTKIRQRKVDGINVYECNRYNFYTFVLYFCKLDLLLRQKQFLRVFKHVIRQIDLPDVVHAHIIQWAVPAIIIKEKYHLPFVITEHWSRMNADIISSNTMIKTFAYSQADKVICVSEALAAGLKRKCNIDSIVIHNMVNDKFFRGQKKTRNDAIFKFIAIGRLRMIKRFDILVDAFALCHFPENVSLDIVGEGKERTLIEKKILENGLYGKVRLLGVRSPEEVNELLCQSDCFVLSSRSETFAIVLIEAMAKGLPVIATKCGGPETFVRPEDGLLVENENVEELAKAMKYMKNHSQEYDSDEIRRHCRDNFSQDVITNKIIEIYNEVLDNNKLNR